MDFAKCDHGKTASDFGFAPSLGAPSVWKRSKIGRKWVVKYRGARGTL